MPKRPARPRPIYPHQPTPRPAFKPVPPVSAHAPRPPRALIWIDGDPIRSKARKEYEKARRDLDKARVQMERFQTQDVPAFTRWMNATFGQQLTESRELSRKLAEQGALLAEIDEYMLVFGVGPGEAYAAVMHHRAHPEEASPQPPPRGGPGGPRGPGGPGAFMDDEDDEDEDDPDFDPRSDEAIYEQFAKAFEQAFGQAPPPGFRPPGPPPKPTRTASVKDLYRALVRKLHPDTQATMTPQKLEWWHEVQEAYADNDAERLEVILNLIAMSEGEPTAQTSVSLLKRIIARLKASLREIKREVTARRRDPAWNFTTSADHETLAARIRQELAIQVEHLHRAYAADEIILSRFAADARRHTERIQARAKKSAPKRPPPPGQKRPPGQNEFYF